MVGVVGSNPIAPTSLKIESISIESIFIGNTLPIASDEFKKLSVFCLFSFSRLKKGKI
jgi:hypothetical protein